MKAPSGGWWTGSGAKMDPPSYAEVFEHSLDAVLLSRPDGTVLAANPSACAVLRASEEEICAMGRSAIADPTDDRWRIGLEERARTGRTRAQVRMRRADGTTFECALTSSIYRAEGGDLRSCTIFRDVTSDVEVLRALAASEAQWRTTVDHAPIGIALVGLDGRWLSVNAAVCEIVGRPEDELLALSFQDITHPDDLDADLALLGQLVAGVIPRYEMEKRYLRADGAEVPIRLSVSLVRDEHGAPVHFVSQIQDIRAELAHVAAITASERHAQRLADQHRLLLESAAEGIWGMDRHGRFTFMNPAAARMLGWSAEEVIGRSAHRLVHHSHPDGTPWPPEDCPVRDVLATGRGCRVEDDVLWRRDGTSFPVAYSSHPLERDGVVDGAVITFSDTTERARAAKALREANARLQELATTDALTGLPNRALLSDRLDQAIAVAEREGWEVAVLFVDLDRFKQVNDSLGHHCGDELLTEVARRISSVLRESDTIARLGGDEFAILLSGSTSAEQAAAAAERVLTCFRSSFTTGDTEVFGTASIGVALWPQDCTTKSELLQHADLAMYRAKAAGGASFEMFQPIMTLAVRQQLQLGNDLRRAVDAGELFLRYHPQVDLATGAVHAVEALVRWQHPTRGEVAPVAFIPLAEETGLIITIGEWVLVEACRQAARWRDAFPDRAPIRVSVNVSPKQLAHPGFTEVVLAALATTGTPPEEIELEITESTLISESGPAVSTVRRLREIGLSIAIDDFGTGYSSLAYLQRFPVDRLKLDMSFIAGLATGGGALVGAAVDLAHALGLEAVAEGVETEEQRKMLLDIGCTQGQGYLWTVPLRGHELDTWLKEWCLGTVPPDRRGESPA